MFADLDRLWRTFDRELQQGKLKHLEYDPVRKTLSWRKPKADKEAALQASFYAKLPAHDIADIFRPVNGTVITGDMHSINKANFAILHWFGLKLAPRFTNLQAQLKHWYCGNDPAQYQHGLIQPVGQIDRQLIVGEKGHIDQIVATLGLKEMTQSTLVRKLCTLSQHNRTRQAIFEFDKLIHWAKIKEIDARGVCP